MTPTNIIWEEKLMRGGMVWHPEEGDQKINQYLDQTNHAPYAVIFGLLVVGISAFTGLVLMGTF
ncbi:MAG: hypothetical protein AAGA80_10075 [Cyanobacteria bacterium P01_F01_bin.143]